MSNQMAMPESKEFPHKPTYDALYQLYGVLTGLLDWEIDLHFRGGLTVDQSVLINDSLTVIDNTTLGTSGTDTLTVQATSTFVNDVTMQGDLDVQGVLTIAGNLTVPGNLQVNGDTALGNGATDTTLIAGPLTANTTVNIKGNLTVGDQNTDTALFAGPVTMNESLNVKNNSTFGDANTDTALFSGPVTMNESLNVKNNVTLGDAEGDTVTLVDWVIGVTSNDLIFKDDAGAEIVRFGDTSSTWHVDVTGPLRASGTISTGGDLIQTSVGGKWGMFASAGNVKQTITGVKSGTLPQLQTVVGNILSAIANHGVWTDSTT